MNIALNFLAMQSGGGVQVGLDFIRNTNLSNANESNMAHQWWLVAAEGSPFASLKLPHGMQRGPLVSPSMLHRWWFEKQRARDWLRSIDADVCFTPFGMHWPNTGVPNVIGFGYSNLLYPEVDFWRGLSVGRRYLNGVRDHLRLGRVRTADHVIFETAELRRRAIEQFNFDSKRSHWINPAVSRLLWESPSDPMQTQVMQKRCAAIPLGFRVVIVSAYQVHKNFEWVLAVLKRVRERRQYGRLVIVTTLGEDAASRRLLQEVETAGLQSNWHNLGPVPYEQLQTLYDSVDAVLLPSRLESFSNSMVEAWRMRRPLIVSDRRWARDVCGDAAAYWSLDDLEQAAATLEELAQQTHRRQALVEAGLTQLEPYADSSRRFREQLKVLEMAATAERVCTKSSVRHMADTKSG